MQLPSGVIVALLLWWQRVAGHCALDFLEQLDTYIALSGCPLQRGRETPGHATCSASVAGDLSGRCGVLGGFLAQLSFDIHRYIRRELSGQPSAVRRSILQRVADYYNQAGTEQLARGVALCVPATCTEPEELVSVGMMFLLCTANGNCYQGQYLDEPWWGKEIYVVPYDPSMRHVHMLERAGDQEANDSETASQHDMRGERDAVDQREEQQWLVEDDGRIQGSGQSARREPEVRRVSFTVPCHDCRRALAEGMQDLFNVTARLPASAGLFQTAFATSDGDPHGHCQALDGHIVVVGFNVLGYISRAISGWRRHRQEALAEHLRVFFGRYTDAPWRSPMCVPTSCLRHLREEVPKIALLYAVWIAAPGSFEDLDALGLRAPLWGEEVQVAFRVQGHLGNAGPVGMATGVESATTGGSDDEAPYRGGCLESWRASKEMLAASSGAIVELGLDTLQMHLFYAQEASCRSNLGYYAVARFDIDAYVSCDHGVLHGDTKAALGRLRSSEFVDCVHALAWRRHGVGICMPASCADDPSSSHEVALEYFASVAALGAASAARLPRTGVGGRLLEVAPRMAGVLPMSSSGSWRLWPRRSPPLPKAASSEPGEELGQLHGALWGLHAACADAAGFALGCAETYVGRAGECRCAPRARSRAASAADSPGGFDFSSWAECKGTGFSQDWHLLRELIQASSGDPGSDASVVSLSDVIVRRYEWRAIDWAFRSQATRRFCNTSYILILDEWLPRDTFSPLLLLFHAESAAWRRWAPWLQFCVAGYVAALYFRARALEAQRLREHAMESLSLALKMFGPCHELDLLNQNVWRVSLLDIEVNLMRLRSASPDGRPAFAHSERPRSWRPFRSFRETFPTKALLASAYVWSALRQNTLLRRFYRAAAAECPEEARLQPPALVLLAWPAEFAVFAAPQILLQWPGARLAIFSLGGWGARWDRCRDCKPELEGYVAREQHLLDEGLPRERPDSLGILWGAAPPLGGKGQFSPMHLVALLHHVFRRSQEFEAASVLVCSAHLWLCMTARLVTEKPLLAVDLASPNQGMPDGMDERWYVTVAQRALGPSTASLHTLVMRDELLRAVLPSKGCTFSVSMESPKGEVECFDGTWEIADFVPFTGQPSLYVRARWASSSLRHPFLVMREGSAGKLSKTLWGRLFFAILEHLASAASLDVRFLIQESARLSHEEVARHRAAISFLGITNAKRTPHDLYMMEVPLFFPAKSLKAVALDNTGYYASTPCDIGTRHSQEASWDPLPPFCLWVRAAFQLELSSLYRLPHLLLFEGAADLVQRLGATGDPELQRTSEAMRRFTAQRTEDQLVLWRDALLAMACAAARGPGAAAASAADLPRPAHRSHSDPHCLFGLASADAAACCAMSCGTCEEPGCEALPPGRLSCCPELIRAEAPPCSGAPAPCALGPAVRTSGGCEQHPAGCSSEVLDFATHLDERPAVT